MTSGDVTTQGTGASPGGQAQQWSPARNPTRRPMLRTALTIGVAASVFLVCLLILLGILGDRLTTQTIVTSALMAIIPVLVIVPTFLWLDRYEAEPARYIVFAFLWGALVAVVGAFFLNTFGLKMLVEARWTDPLETGAVYLAPVTEETLKGLGILLIYLFRRREFDGIIDGIVYAGLIGAGFAFSENILYLGQAYNEYGGARRLDPRRVVLRHAAPRPLEPLGARRDGRLLRGVRLLPGAALPRLHRLPPLAASAGGSAHRSLPLAVRRRRLAHPRRGHDALPPAAASCGAGLGAAERRSPCEAVDGRLPGQRERPGAAALAARPRHRRGRGVGARDGAARGDHVAPS